jgi:transporter family-2 protein
MSGFYIFLAMVVGAGAMVQAGINYQLSGVLGSAVSAAFVSFAVGTTALALFALLSRMSMPEMGRIAQAPWHLFVVGGALGAMFVATTIILVPKLGASAFLAAVVAGQMICALLLDHWGLVSFPRHTFSPCRGLGAVMLLGGVILIRRF